MKKNILWFMIILFYFCNTESNSRSFFRPRDVSTDSTLELALVNYHRYHSLHDGTGMSFYAKPFWIRSENSNKLAQYFLPHNKCCITLDESGFGDVDPLWLNLISPIGSFYTSTVCLAPKRTVAGALLTFYIDFCAGWWFGINTAAMQVTTNTPLCEIGSAQTGTCPGFANAYDAFNNPAWCSGRITNCKQKKGGLDDIQFKLGYDFYRTDEQHAGLYLVGTAPTGKNQKTPFLFPPLVGSKHGSFGVGFDGGFIVRECGDSLFSIMTDLKYRYIFSAQECRSFDLCQNGDWSRYLLVVTQSEPLNSQPGINLLTVPVKVTERNTVDFWLAGHYQWCNFNVECGYEFWYRQAEKICKKCPIQPGFGIQTLSLCGLNVTSASMANITQAASGANITVSDAQFTAITDNDLNILSGAHPTALSNKIYASFGYAIDRDSHSWLLGINASYEFGNKNALNQIALWFTAGITF